ncbi:MAG: hypothetical protein AAFZ49_17080 [Cyanobacteria bacterium J06659_2]
MSAPSSNVDPSSSAAQTPRGQVSDGPLPAYLEQSRASLKRAIARFSPNLHLARSGNDSLQHQAALSSLCVSAVSCSMPCLIAA